MSLRFWGPFRHRSFWTGRWGCGACGYVGFWLKATLRFHQRFTCAGHPSLSEVQGGPK